MVASGGVKAVRVSSSVRIGVAMMRATVRWVCQRRPALKAMSANDANPAKRRRRDRCFGGGDGGGEMLEVFGSIIDWGLDILWLCGV